VRKEDLTAFVRRDWNAVAALKRRWWAGQKSRMTPAEALNLGDELRRHVSALRDDWPTAEDRRKDLAFHIRLSELLGRVKPPERACLSTSSSPARAWRRIFCSGWFP